MLGGYELNKVKQSLPCCFAFRCNMLYRSSLVLSSRIMGIGVTITRDIVEIGVGTWGR
jgi:hypothetical protein